MGKLPLDSEGRSLKDRIREAARDMGPEFHRGDLGAAAGVTRASVSDWFTGKTQTLKGETLVRAAAYLDVNPAWLGHGEGQKRAPTIIVENDDEALLLTLFREMDVEQKIATLGVAKLGRVVSHSVDPDAKPARKPLRRPPIK